MITDARLQKVLEPAWDRTVANLQITMGHTGDMTATTPIDALCGLDCTLHHEVRLQLLS